MTAKKKGDSLTIEGKLKAALVPEAAQPDPIPENWVWTRITALADQRRGVSYSKSDASSQPVENSILVLRGGNIQHGEFQIGDDCVYVPNDYVSASQILQIGDVIIVASSGSKSLVGKAAQVKDQMPDTSFGAFLTLFRPYQPIDAKYFGWFFQSRYYRNAISEASIGININNLRREHFEALTIPLPPLPEQRRIAEKLESLLGKIKEARALLGEIPEILQNFRQMVLSAACSGRLTEDWRKANPKVESAAKLLKRIQKDRKRKYDEACRMAKEQGTKKPQENYSVSVIRDKAYIPTWAEAKLDNLIYIAGRIGWRGLKAEEYTEDGPLFLSVYSLNYGEEVDFRDTFHISMERYEESPEIQLQENDILLAKDGAGIGKIGIVRNLNQLATVNSSLLVIRCQEAFIPKFLFYFLSGPQLQDIVKTRITGSATPHLFQRDIKEFVLSIPPLAEQEEIVARVESLFSKADDLEAQYKEAMELIETLPETILLKAFRGELVPQDPNDEPASVLLKRIIESLDKKEPIEIFIEEVVVVKDKVTVKKRIPLFDVLKEANDWLSAADLLHKAGYPRDADPDTIEDFYQQLKQELKTTPQRIERERRKENDYFRAL